MRLLFQLEFLNNSMELTIRAELTAETFDAIDVFAKDATSSLLMVVKKLIAGIA